MLLCKGTVTKLICLISEHIDQVNFLTIFLRQLGHQEGIRGF